MLRRTRVSSGISDFTPDPTPGASVGFPALRAFLWPARLPSEKQPSHPAMNRNQSILQLLRWSTCLLAATTALSPVTRAQQAAAAPATAPAESERPAVVTTAPATRAADQVVELSPFEVSTSRDRGYEASSTMSGTRLNSNLADLAASISVVTKQQLLDTASIDINDVFKYEANTEGIYQWTSFVNDRGTISDDIQANPTSATRMRGLTAANTAVNGFASSLPFDSYNVESVEISRGPNSSVFGLGDTGGGVNIIAARANLTREITSFGTRGDSYGGYRANFDLNRVLLKDRVAIRVMGVYDEKGFVREPSSETIRRLETALTIRPFKNTTLRGSFESYRDNFNRPNSTTPRDGISDWIANGRPTWDPITRTVHFGNGDPAITGITSTQEATRLPYGIDPYNTAFNQFFSWYIDDGQIQFSEINAMPTSTGTGPTSVNSAGLHLLQCQTFYGRYSSQYPLYLTPGITDKSLYDWTSINISAPNYGKTKGETYNVDFEQFFLNTPRQTLALQASWMGEHTSTINRTFLGNYGNAGGKLQVYVDINEKLLDGSANPYFLRPYLGYPRPNYNKSRSVVDDYRSTLAYELNLTNEKGWLKWLGRHRLSGYGEYRSVYSASLSYTDTMSSNEAWMAAGGASPANRNSNYYRPYVHYLVGDANGYNVEYGPKGIVAPPLSTTLRYYNGVTAQWIDEPVDFDEYYMGNRPNRRLLGTYGGTWQGFFLDDRIIPTFGWRWDSNRTRDANSAINPTAATNGFYDLSSQSIYDAYPWVQNRGKTTTSGVVVKPLSWLHLLYNQSNSFIPGALAYTINGEPLPDPKGKTRDYGFQFILLDGRLSIRAQQYETLDIGRGSSSINTYIQRTLRMDGGPSVTTTSTDPNLASWYGNEVSLIHPSWTLDQVMAEVLAKTGIDAAFIAGHYGKVHGDRSNSTSRGKEIEITFNPTRYWTMRSTITQTLAFNGNMSEDLQDYIDARMPTWTTIRGPSTNNLWWTSTIGSSTPQTFYTSNVLAPVSLAVATQGKQRTQTREWHFNVVANYKLAGITDNRWLKALDLGGAIRWEDKACIGFYGAAPDPDGIVRQYDADRPIWDKARYYFDLSAGYNFRLFNNKVRARVQLNVSNIFENGRLQAVAVNPDGSPYAFRIVDPRQFILSATFDL
jgi:outer membrane receptor protein involved in Fe transport